MVDHGTDLLAAALEACAEALERRVGASPEGGSLPRLRPRSIGGTGPGAWPAPGLDLEAAAAREAEELAAEFRDVAREVQAGRVGPGKVERGWINSLVGRASRYLDEDLVARVRMASVGVV